MNEIFPLSLCFVFILSTDYLRNKRVKIWSQIFFWNFTQFGKYLSFAKWNEEDDENTTCTFYFYFDASFNSFFFLSSLSYFCWNTKSSRKKRTTTITRSENTITDIYHQYLKFSLIFIPYFFLLLLEREWTKRISKTHRYSFFLCAWLKYLQYKLIIWEEFLFLQSFV